MTTIDCRTCARQLRAVKAQRVLIQERLSIGENEARVLCAVPDSGEIARSDLGRLSGVNGAMLSRAVGSLERSGLLVTRCDDTDRRRILVSKTTEGCEAAEWVIACCPRRLPIARKTWRRLSACIEARGVPPNEFLALLALDEHTGMRASEIARQTGLPLSSVHHALSQLERAAFVKGTNVADDRRTVVSYDIEPDGKELINIIKYQVNS